MSDEKKPVRVSKAPPPITPIRGSGWSSPRVTARAPDWDFWRHVQRAEVWQVCALSLNIDPDSLERGAYGEWRGFASKEVAERFDKRIRLYSNITNTLAHSEIKLSDFAAWAVKEMKWSDLPPELVVLAQMPAAAPSGTPESEEPPASKATPADNTSELAALFDPVKPAQLEAMFPDGDKWKSYAERANRNGLEPARIERGLFNPYLAAAWWIKKGPTSWTWERCQRKLANNLPARSRDSKHLITGEYE